MPVFFNSTNSNRSPSSRKSAVAGLLFSVTSGSVSSTFLVRVLSSVPSYTTLEMVKVPLLVGLVAPLITTRSSAVSSAGSVASNSTWARP